MFYCKECGNESKKWYGKCPFCKEYNTFVEIKEQKINSNNNKGTRREEDSEFSFSRLEDIKISEDDRILTDISELDYVLGGGLVKGSLVLLGGNPGIGKSTLTIQVSERLAKDGKLLYISGEESQKQIKARAKRLELDISQDFYLSGTKNIDIILSNALKNQVKYLIIDSIQTVYSSTVNGVAGSVSQVKECTLKLMYFAKENGISVLIIGHVTKDGDIAGPKLLEHMVDVVLYLEGEKTTNYKILRTKKNRYGRVDEIGIFEMEQTGLKSVHDVENYFLKEDSSVSGQVIGSTIEGDRILFLDVESLLIKTEYGFAKRTVQGYDLSRFNLLLGLVQKRLNINLNQDDCYLNISCTMRNDFKSLDLPIIVSLISSKNNLKIDRDTVFLGEIDLGGELKRDNSTIKKIDLAEKMGFKKIYCRFDDEKKYKKSGIEIINCRNINDVLQHIENK